jgi:hypothetical protein
VGTPALDPARVPRLRSVRPIPVCQSVQYSFYRWDGIGAATPAGWTNWQAIFTKPELLDSVIHVLVLIIFYTVLPVSLGLVAAGAIRQLRPGRLNTTAWAMLFVPPLLPLVAAELLGPGSTRRMGWSTRSVGRRPWLAFPCLPGRLFVRSPGCTAARAIK